MEKLVAIELLQHILPEGGETIEQLEDRARKAGYDFFVRETGGLLLHYHQYRLDITEQSK